MTLIKSRKGTHYTRMKYVWLIYFRNQMLLILRACNTKFWNEKIDLAEIFEFKHCRAEIISP